MNKAMTSTTIDSDTFTYILYSAQCPNYPLKAFNDYAEAVAFADRMAKLFNDKYFIRGV